MTLRHGVVYLGLAAVLAGCSTIALEPGLPFPPAPPGLSFSCSAGTCCLPQSDANALSKWLQKLGEFKRERDKLLKGQTD